jgi:hypothetical protein
MEKPRAFISWSGEMSRQVGNALREWLPHIFPYLDIWISTQDLDKGTRWLTEVVGTLRNAHFAIVCLTPDNLASPWLLFEAGAISNLPEARVFTFLHRLEYAQIKPPLWMFNHTLSTRGDVEKLVLSMNKQLGELQLDEAMLRMHFSKFWPDLSGRLEAISVAAVPAMPMAAEAGEPEIVREILTLARETSRQVARITPREDSQRPEDRRKVRDIILSRFSRQLMELGVKWQQMGVPSESPGGISLKLADRDFEISIGEAADLVDGIVKPIEFLKKIGLENL